MKKILVLIMIFALLALACACGKKEPETAAVPSETAEPTAAVTAVPGAANEPEATQEPVEEETQEPELVSPEIIEAYLGLLGYDASADYGMLDYFPAEKEGDYSVLMDIYDMTAEDFETMKQTMSDNGCHLVTDPTGDEAKNTKIRQYRNADDSIYIEMVYSGNDEYLTVLFQPLK